MGVFVRICLLCTCVHKGERACVCVTIGMVQDVVWPRPHHLIWKVGLEKWVIGTIEGRKRGGVRGVHEARGGSGEQGGAGALRGSC